MNFKYTYSRLQTAFSAVYIANTEVETAVELEKYKIVLDNEVERKETMIEINAKTFNLLKGHFDSISGKNLEDINIDELVVLSCYPIKGLEDISSFVSIIEYHDGSSLRFLLVLTDKIDGGEHSIEIGQDIYEELTNYVK